MAEVIVSPGVFTREIDQSFLQPGIGQIGGAVIGPTVDGEAFVPTKVSSLSDYFAKFGSYSDDTIIPHMVREYLSNATAALTVTRIMNTGGYELNSGVLAIIATSGSVEKVTHILHPVQTIKIADDLFDESVLADGVSGSFAISFSGSYVNELNLDVPGFSGTFFNYAVTGTPVSMSINPAANNYVSKVLPNSPKSSDFPLYVQYEFPNAFTAFANAAGIQTKLAILPKYEFLQDYKTATTPWITSQQIGPITKNLFKFHTRTHGEFANFKFKVGIQDIRTSNEVSDPNGYPTFTVVIRRVNSKLFGSNIPYVSSDTDSQPDIVESFANVNLDPDSPRYIARVIGDRYQTVTANGDLIVNGEYTNRSNFVRVEVAEDVALKTINKIVFPFGFRALSSTIPNASGSVNIPNAAYVTTQEINNQYSNRNFFGFDFSTKGNLNYLGPVPTSGSTIAGNTDFYLGDVNQSSGAAFPSAINPYTGSLGDSLNNLTFTSNIKLSTRKFIVPLQGGFDGAAPNLPKFGGTNISATNTYGFDCSTSTSPGTLSYQRALNLLSNTEQFDINMLVTPGIIESLHPIVTSAAREMVTQRQDTFYVFDSVGLTDNITTAVNTIQPIDSNYSATYYPWVRISDPSKNKPIWVPPSVVVPAALVFNDSVQAPWYAPAGLNRGSLNMVSETYRVLRTSERDQLYSARINPIASYPNEGISIWGQKTLQAQPSALDRVNVRRMLITVKKFIASATRFLVFEQNTVQTRERFLAIVNPYLEDVQRRQGLTAFRVIMDASNNTSDLIDQNILYGQLFLQPTRTAEFIILDFNIQPTGAAFPE